MWWRTDTGFECARCGYDAWKESQEIPTIPKDVAQVCKELQK